MDTVWYKPVDLYNPLESCYIFLVLFGLFRSWFPWLIVKQLLKQEEQGSSMIPLKALEQGSIKSA